MSDLIPSSYFNGKADIHQLDESTLDQRIKEAPYDASLRLLAALKSGNPQVGQSMLYSRDRILMAKMLETKQSNHISLIDNTSDDTSPSFDNNNENSDAAVDIIELEPTQLDDNISMDKNLASGDVHIDKAPKSESDKKIKKKGGKKSKDKKSFRLHEFGGISPFAQWLISFKVDDLDKRLKKEAKKEKKRQLEENAKKSVTRSSSTISEPLAEILRMQGHLDDAKKMYGQLMQKFPEKSSYFAAKIEEINKVK